MTHIRPRPTSALAARIDSAIDASPYLSRRCVSVATESERDCLVVEGVVPSYFHKQMAQETLLRVEGVRRIDNRLQVDPRSSEESSLAQGQRGLRG